MRFEEVVVRNPVTASVTFQPAGNLFVEIVVAVNEAGTQDADVVAFCTAKEVPTAVYPQTAVPRVAVMSKMPQQSFVGADHEFNATPTL